MKNGNMESIKFPHTKYGNRFAGNTGCLGKSSSPLHCCTVWYHLLEFNYMFSDIG
jgi:hypothetical protein